MDDMVEREVVEGRRILEEDWRAGRFRGRCKLWLIMRWRERGSGMYGDAWRGLVGG